MEHTDKEFCLEVWGDLACFTRPEFKVERVSYDVITPSAARAIFDAIFWKPAIRWEITKIHVINPIRWTNIRRNEVGAVAKKSPIFIEDKRQQRNSLMLKDVRYRIYAKMIYIPVSARSKAALTREPDKDENPMKYYEIFQRRAKQGQCFNQPYLGTRECIASFKLIESNEKIETINDSIDLGLMFYDWDYTKSKNKTPKFFKAIMENGKINVPPYESEEILK